MITAFIAIVFSSVLLIPFVSTKWKGIITVMAVCMMAVLTSVVAIQTLGGTNFEYSFKGSLVTGKIPVRIDALSGWFILIINFTFITGAFYGFHYMKPYRSQTSNLSLHCISYTLVYAAIISICSLQNSIAFLTAWEIMALGSFLLIIFEHYKKDTISAGINFLIQSHVCILFLSLGFIWVALKMNSYDFKAIHDFSLINPMLSGVALFLCFFIGFAIKAGFVPFHTWLPYAHPAAPSHISGVLSGVIIKIGIYGILRMLLLIKTDYTLIGVIILFFSLVSGIYGVMLAILQHNLKRLLAYHSIENIGIIGIGIGLGCIGMGKGNGVLTVLGFAGALLHTLNHSLFKSILFYGAGNVYQSTHTMNIEQLGGIGKKMPQTSFLFLIAALAICGLPPFNGFVSEFIIYNGLFAGLKETAFGFLFSIVSSLFALALIGGLALLCFTKAFGTVFLGTPRSFFKHAPREAGFGKLIPMYAATVMILLIGVYPKFFIDILSEPVHLFTQPHDTAFAAVFSITNPLSMIGYSAIGFVALAGLIFLIKKRYTISKPYRVDATWGCGYVATTNKMQYSASSFVRAYRKLAEPVLLIHKKKIPIKAVFPIKGAQETVPYDKAELWLIDFPLRQLKHFFSRFAFLQNGNTRFYILYGMIFISLVLIIPILFAYVRSLIQFLNHL
jgi:Formate hydrogenlyase subunit 3/Multisubunit Na+/H+ antiporter, MnhD subunit